MMGSGPRAARRDGVRGARFAAPPRAGAWRRGWETGAKAWRGSAPAGWRVLLWRLDERRAALGRLLPAPVGSAGAKAARRGLTTSLRGGRVSDAARAAPHGRGCGDRFIAQNTRPPRRAGV